MHFVKSISMMVQGLLALTLFSCSGNSSDFSIYDDRHLTLSDFDVKKKEIDIVMPFKNRYSCKQLYSDSLLYGASTFRHPNIIDVLNLTNIESSYQIKIDPNLIKGNFSSFFVHSLDSIFLTLPSNKSVALIDGGGNLLKYYKLGTAQFSEFDLMPFIQSIPITHKNKLIVNLRPMGLLEDGKFLIENQFVAIDLARGTLTAFGKAQSIATYLHEGEVNTDFYSPYFVINEADELVVSYPFSPTLQVFDLNTFQLKKEIRLTSGIVKTMSAFANNTIHSNSFDNASYRSSIAAFTDLNYHSEIKGYSILLMHPFESVDETGKLKTWQNRRSSLLFFDSDFNVVKEFIFDNGDLLMNSIIATEKSIVYAKFQETDEEDKLSYSYELSLGGM